MAGASKQRAKAARQGGNGNGSGGNNPAAGNSSSAEAQGTASNEPKDTKVSDSPETQQASSSSESPPQRGSPPAGWDGNRDPSTLAPGGPAMSSAVRNLDLGLHNSYLIHGNGAPTDVAPRPQALNKTGSAVAVKINSWAARISGMKVVHQYDVVIGSGVEKRGLTRRVWESEAVKKVLGAGWIFDGNKIAYSQKKLPENVSIDVNMDKEKGRAPRKGKDGKEKPDVFACRVKWTKQVPMQSLEGYLNNKSGWDVGCLEAMTFLDHLLRQSPSNKMTMIKRSFYHNNQERFLLGGGVEAMKGVYVTIRPVLAQFGHPAALSINVDVANTTFWTTSALHNTAKDVTGARDVPDMIAKLRSGGPIFRLLRRLQRIRVQTTYSKDEFIIDKFLPTTADEKKFNMTDAATGKERQISIAQYMQEKYKIRLTYPTLPLVKMTKGSDTCIPMELLKIAPEQRYAFKLSDVQTSQMIKFAVSLPDQRWRDIDRGVAQLDWRNDVYLKNYGLETGPPANVTGTLLPSPKVLFANRATADPGTSGRWDLRGKRFYESNAAPLKSWGVCIAPGRQGASREEVQAFIQNFVRVYEGHGGKIATKQPVIIIGPSNFDAAANVEALWNATGHKFNQAPELLVFIVPSKSAEYYQRTKKSTDCRYGVVSQVLQAVHVQRNQGQYCSNVATKVNAKLGGCTARAESVYLKGKPWFTRPTLVLGVDVSHGAPGAGAPSIAAVTASWDRMAMRYAAAVETNGSRVEMLTRDTMNNTLKPLISQWVKTIGGNTFPQHIYYLRDGVSEGQYSQVLSEEIKGLEAIVKEVDPKAAKPLLTVLTCTKRHHIRFFPERGDRNKNALPGTLVEQGVTDPRDFDFYLCAHSAIKGTARPVHYTVLRDDAKLSPSELQNMLYESSYQYVRSTTPVSLHPAIYYAHLAAMRATSHINTPSQGSGPEDNTKTGPTDPDAEVKRLLEMPNGRGIRGTMWYV